MRAICEGPLTSMALCWRAERADGAGVALTSHDEDVVVGDVRYVPQPGMTPAAATKRSGLDPGSSEAAGVLSASAFNEQDLTLGRWDAARIALAAVDWRAPERVGVSLLTGELGEVCIDGDSFSAELLGAAARLRAAPCPVTSPECRAQFGDPKCRIDLAGRSIRAMVVFSEANQMMLDRNIEDRFVAGQLRYRSGPNCGLSSTIIAVTGNSATIRDRPQANIEPGTVVVLTEGCDKRFETCEKRFANAANFRGEPHLPGMDLLTRYPGA